MADKLKIAYLSFADIRKVRSRNICQVIAETDISQFRALADLDEQSGIFIPLKLNAPEGVYELDVDTNEIQGLLKTAVQQMAPIDSRAVTTSKSLAPSLAQSLWKRGYFFNRELWAACEKLGVYTQKDHLTWVRQQDPILFYPSVRSEGGIEAHHVNTIAEGAGKGLKANDWFAVPLMTSQHRHFHDHGTRQDRERMLEMAVRMTAGQIADRLKEFLGRDSWSGVTEEDMRELEAKTGFRSGWWRD